MMSFNGGSHVLAAVRLIGGLLTLDGGMISAEARGGPGAENRWNAQHIEQLPAEVRSAISSYAQVCGAVGGRTLLRALFPKRKRKFDWSSFRTPPLC